MMADNFIFSVSETEDFASIYDHRSKCTDCFHAKLFGVFKFVITTDSSYSMDMFKYPAINMPLFPLSVWINYFAISAFLWIVQHFGQPHDRCLLHPP